MREVKAGWSTVELCSLLRDGQATYGIVQPGAHDEQGVPILRVKDLRGGAINAGDPLRVANGIEAKHDRTRLGGGEVLVSLVGTVGEVAVVPDSLRGWNVARAIAVLRPAHVVTRWLAYALQAPAVQTQLHSALNTTVQATLNLSDLKRLRLAVPPLPEQQAIAEVLGALDDKIAANTTVAATADSVASAQFDRQVQHANLGPATFGDVAEVGGGGTPKTKIEEYWGGDVRWATPTDVTGLVGPYLFDTARRITESGLGACSSKLYPAGSILMTSRATIGAFAIAEHPTSVNQGFIVVQPHDPDVSMWIFHEMRSRVDDFVAHANGATFLELSRGRFKLLPVRLADNSTMHAFQTYAAGLHERASSAIEENRTLAELRDTLLPQLMSGRLRVRDAIQQVEEVV
ncbi:type I restriction enzyme S subunit [Mumia flava]|uniref:Type I restriction enzyme S subunit n=1 Tax=Mumia flava TaxID=1348852 RepID=A0A2M9B7Y5_9ACTN|nr:restriction endonuclease subunit S [Mumia flava]PJJ54031.1 type I restriction enzyme S subunit [Mumia flava]